MIDRPLVGSTHVCAGHSTMHTIFVMLSTRILIVLVHSFLIQTRLWSSRTLWPASKTFLAPLSTSTVFSSLLSRIASAKSSSMVHLSPPRTNFSTAPTLINVRTNGRRESNIGSTLNFLNLGNGPGIDFEKVRGDSINNSCGSRINSERFGHKGKRNGR